MSEQRGDDLDLSQFWNDVAGGPGPLDPDTAAAVRRLQALASAPLPASARERVRRRVLPAESATAKEQRLTSVLELDYPYAPAGLNGRFPSPRALVRDRAFANPRRGWMRTIAPIALVVLLLTGLGGWLLLGAPWPGTGGHHAAIPAPLATPAATPDPAAYQGVLINMVIANQPLTSQYVDVEELRFNSGYGFAGNYAADSNFVELVTKGELTVTVNGPTQVFRGLGAKPQTGAAGVPQVLEAGDAIAIGPRTNFKTEHTGDAPAVFVSFNILDPNISGPSQANDALYQIAQGSGSFAPGPLRLVVRRITLKPGETFSRPASKIFMVIGPEDPSSSITGFLLGDAINDGKTPAHLLVMTLEPVGAATGTLVYASASPPP